MTEQGHGTTEKGKDDESEPESCSPFPKNREAVRFPLPGVAGRILSIDYGDRRVGLAISDPTRTIASAAGFILRRAGKRPPIAEIVRRGTELEAVAVVLGLPLDDNGDETPRSQEVRRVAAELERRTGWPVSLVDERYSTAAALRAIRDMQGSTRGRKGDVDALAATILLQHALHMAH
ncbi:MAG TPA: Holliday junction resolvase RuvX [Gemmatimonadaceae bacterium]|nr:Holliday junction resolvase RuvX [Gemmatimonadaceae bacterium]